MKEETRQTEFLRTLQHRIDRYKPILEREFDVALGDVVAKSLRTREWLSLIYARSDDELHATAMSKNGRPPTAIRRGLHRLEKLLLWFPAVAFLSFRQWYPDYFLKWRDETREVLVSFAGWSPDDYVENMPKLDQLAVHEMAHGVWNRIVQDQEESHNRRWRLWNEGFAHYIADVHMIKIYPTEAVIVVEFSKFREYGKQLVTDLVDQHGADILKSIPRQWSEFDSRVTRPRAS